MSEQAAGTRRGMLGRIALVAAPLILLGAAAAVTAILRGGVSLQVTVPISSVLLVLGVLASLVLLVVHVLLPRRRARRAAELDRARTEVAVHEQEAHRRFLRRLDHELKNPVTAIRSALAAGDPLPPQNVQIAAGQARRVGDLVGQLRALSSLETREIERMPVALGPLVEEEMAALREELAARGALRTLRAELPTVPWPLPDVVGDADLLRVLVRNLLVNAVKYADDGAVVEVRGTEDDGMVTLEIADTGWGIRPEDLAQVWDELWRADDARGIEGTGLGLAMVRAIIARHGGRAAISSVIGRGTRLRISLPRA